MIPFKKQKFKKIIDYKSGYTWSKDQEVNKYEPSSVRVLTVTNIQEKLDLSSELYLRDVKLKDRIEKAVSKDWCIAVSSNGNRKRIGNAVYISDNRDFLFASFLTAFKPKSDADLLPKYFFYWLSSHAVQERITSVAEGTTGLGNLDIRFLRNIEVEYPEDEDEQTAIASILSKVDEAIAATEASIKAAERLKKALMQNLLTGKLKPDGTWRKEDEFYVDEKFGKVPLDWLPKKWGELIKLEYGKSLKTREGTVPVYGTNGPIGFTEVPLYKSRGIIIGRKGEYREIHFSENPFWVIDTAFYVQPRIEFDIKWAYYALRKHDINRFDSGSAIPSTNKKDVYHLKTIMPSDIAEQKAISNKISGIETIVTSKQTKIKILQRLKKSLMQNLLTGKVRLQPEVISKQSATLTEIQNLVTA